jgi:hypothetical protein
VTSEPPHHSFDGRWWWDGDAWRSAFSPDGKYWWDGTVWRLRTERKPFVWPRWLLGAEAAWLAALFAAPLFLLVLLANHRDGHLPRSRRELAIGLAVVGVAATLWLGYTLGRRSLWVHLPVAAILGTATFGMLYVAAMVGLSDPNDTTVDNAAGAGLVIFGVPLFLSLVVLLAVPAGLGRLIARRAQRRVR